MPVLFHVIWLRLLNCIKCGDKWWELETLYGSWRHLKTRNLSPMIVKYVNLKICGHLFDLGIWTILLTYGTNNVPYFFNYTQILMKHSDSLSLLLFSACNTFSFEYWFRKSMNWTCLQIILFPVQFPLKWKNVNFIKSNSIAIVAWVEFAQYYGGVRDPDCSFTLNQGSQSPCKKISAYITIEFLMPK